MTSQPQPSGLLAHFGVLSPCIVCRPGWWMFALRTLSCEIQAPTEIFASREHHYPGGAQVSHSSNVRLQAESEDVLFVWPAAEVEAEAGAEEIGCVRLAPRAEGADAVAGGAQA